MQLNRSDQSLIIVILISSVIESALHGYEDFLIVQVDGQHHEQRGSPSVHNQLFRMRSWTDQRLPTER